MANVRTLSDGVMRWDGEGRPARPLCPVRSRGRGASRSRRAPFGGGAALARDQRDRPPMSPF
ncbi:hypothetical protein C3489_27990 [Streptomyces sp. Ru71]|nr:hypothetical protein C3489_27990 [Streptomyces sp. Ru71]